MTTSRTDSGNAQSTSSLCGTYPTTPRFRAVRGSIPSSRTSPASRRTVPMSALNSVDFPLPFMPTSPVTHPGAISRSTLSRARTRP